MPDQKIRLACRNYTITAPIIRGLVRTENVDLEVVEMKSVPEMFAGAFRGQFDIAEFSLAEISYLISRDQSPLIGIPVFPFRMFRHGYIFCNHSIKPPLSDRDNRIAVPILVLTAGVWQRGILTEEYGISPTKTYWHAASIHHWTNDDNEHGERADFKSRDGSVIHWFEGGSKNPQQTARLALQRGEIDALCTTNNQPLTESNGMVKRLFENYAEAEAEYFRRTRIFPIMHLLAVQKSLIKKQPDLPGRLFNLFVQSKKLGYEWIRAEGSVNLAWKQHYLEQERTLLGGDPWAYGLKQNAHVIEKFLSYCHDQGITARRLYPPDLFAPSTWELLE
jgi:4,5-dihydroxyphthalate decarboxylase